MATKKSKKKRQVSFENLEKDLEKETERTYREFLKARQSSRYLGLGLVLSILLFMILPKLGSSQMVTTVIENAKKTLDNVREHTGFTQSLEASEKEFQFKWTLENYDQLVVGDGKDVTGERLTDIIETYGKPARVKSLEEKEQLIINYDFVGYGNYDDTRRLDLMFYKADDDYYLRQKSIYEIPDEAFPTQEAGSAEDFPWTTTNFEQIVVGSSDSGEGGMTYKEVIALGGLPQRAIINGYDLIDVTSRELILYYRTSKGSEYRSVQVRLKKQSDGTYRVFTKFSDALKKSDDNSAN